MAYRILIVDDSPIIRAMVKKVLTMAGLDDATMVEAGDGAEAFEALNAEWFDMVFTDLHMPNMSGIELVEKMAADDVLAAIPVVVVSSDRNARVAEQVGQCGVRAFVCKPFRPEDFREIVSEILGEEGLRCEA